MFSTFVALGTIAIQILVVILVVGMISRSSYLSFFVKHSSLLLRFIFVGSVVGSLIYEYVLGYAPCLLCWYQRMAIFPIALLVCLGDIRTNAFLRRAVVVIASIGIVIALLHNYIDIFPTGLDICGATGPSCLARYVYEFGYITIPMMSLTALLAGLLLSLISKRYPQASLGVVSK